MDMDNQNTGIQDVAMDESDDISVTQGSVAAAAATDVPMLSEEELQDQAEHFLKDVFSYLQSNPKSGKRDVKALPRRVSGPVEHTPGSKPLANAKGGEQTSLESGETA
ncbi:hypothetical protein CYLTODRAFT_426588 [Cylindrobasidium torrendii FP15055 ss-10]|uniref:Uncharacterized protein n=1 Tax=Cylindrobasidium torrendii FP15055 ss-10 TaxID=1314674 RepID=A0A0D7AY92_9AGAR|nr:hypothetical protein CYLTODRAFT_426588 [Cylindrobasidium torrendii FP15055 ss-10]